MNVATRVSAELERRRSVNPRYSLRAFARTLEVSHSVVSRLCRGRSRPSMATLKRLEARLGRATVSAADTLRDQQLDDLTRLVRRPGFRADARWMAVRLGLSLDEVQLTLHDALRRGRLVLCESAVWSTSAREEP